jgi:prepilin signal peptidase PulO-like enzyme (type II secretory pathway)
MIAIVVAAIFFACVAFIAAEVSRAVCARVQPLDDGPATGTPPIVVLVAASALLGGLMIARGATVTQLTAAAIVIFALVAAWCSDLLCGLVPDVFTLAPLGALLLLAFTQRDWGILLSALVPFVPFAVAAFYSRGYGMGWGDAKLVALAGAALGAPLALLTLAAACVAAVVGHRLARAGRNPIAFAPYIAACTGLALPLAIVH